MTPTTIALVIGITVFLPVHILLKVFALNDFDEDAILKDINENNEGTKWE